VLALGAAVAIVGTLIGRRVAGPTRSATHLYVIPIAPTGAGKQHLLDATTRLMKVAGAEGHIGPSEFISMPAVVNFLLRKPLALCLQDEYGAFLQRITSKRASGFEASISKILRTLWATSFASITTAEWADRETKLIQSPAISILGPTTPDEFHAALQGESVANGFLNRFLVLNSDLRSADVEPQLEPDAVPGRLAAALRDLYLWDGPQGIMQIDDPEISFRADVLPWASEQARDCYRHFDRMRETRHVFSRSPRSLVSPESSSWTDFRWLGWSTDRKSARKAARWISNRLKARAHLAARSNSSSCFARLAIPNPPSHLICPK
jgi:hypothetical protein